MTSRTPLIRPHLGHTRRKYRSAHAFFITLCLLSAFGLFSYVALGSDGLRESSGAPRTLHKRQVTTFASTDEECRLVRHSTDQCAYIAKHCPDEDAGFYSYLALYYCTLQNFKPVAFIILVAYLGLLFSTIGIAASDFFCINLSTIATILGMSESLAGVTFLAFGNGSPDVFSTFAAFSTDSSSLAIGELFGAACFIAAVVAGAMGVVHPFKVAKKAYVRDISFFMVAAIFSLYCMWDGQLKLWECLTMVGYYVLYVITVVVWHWWFTRRRKQQNRLALARGQYVINVTDEDQEEYRDEPDDEDASRPSMSRGASSENFTILESGGPHDHESVDEERDWVMANLPQNMNLTRGPRARRNTLTPIRPSLVGALEYSALVATLQKSRSQQSVPLHTRSYSDAPNHASLDSDNLSTNSDPATRPPYHMSSPTSAHSPLLERPKPEVRITGSGRSRAVSANDAATLRPDLGFIERHATGKRQFLDVAVDARGRSKSSTSAHSLPLDSIAEAPDLLVSEADDVLSTNPWKDQGGVQFPENFLAVPGGDATGHTAISPPRSPLSQSPRSSPPQRPKLQIPGKPSPGSAPPSPFPEYTDTFPAQISRPPSIYLGPPSISADSQPNLQFGDDVYKRNPLKWWPYSILPPPMDLLARLFPTFQRWHAKSWWERVLAIVAAPSILLLTITLPVIEAEHEEEDAEPQEPASATDTFEPYSDEPPTSPSKTTMASLALPVDTIGGTHSPLDGPGHGSAAVATNLERSHHHPSGPLQDKMHSLASDDAGPPSWCRWLTITQLFLAPMFIVLVLYTQYLDPPETKGALINAICIPLLVSLVLLVPLLATTTTTHRPKAYEPILALAGFVVAIGWISTIAGQVVAVLKALAVILNMSHAVMGLTIFAVGNSLGDLVADVTVAKLGYPVMALSACFGGPMLNILLGIGLSGSWILIRGAQHRHLKHPGKEIKYRSYNIEVGTTLMISGVTLVFTLLVLLIAVPCNKWIMSKKLGWILIGLWTISTVGNVIVVEMYGLGQGDGEALGTIG